MSDRPMRLALALLALGGLWACWCDTAMLWDGAYQFCLTLIAQQPYAYLSRFHSWIVWHPVVWLSAWTDNLKALRFVFGAPFCLAPAASVALSWWIVRRRAPALGVWAVFGAAAAALPGQIFMINDSVFQLHLFWPVFLATFLPLTRAQASAIALASVFQLSHPIGIGLCGAAAAAAFFLAVKKNAAMRPMLLWRAGWHATLALGGIVKLALWPDSYAASEASALKAWNAFRWGVAGWPLAGLAAMWLAGWLLLKMKDASLPERRERFGRVALALVCLAGAMWLFWAADAHRWSTAINYRRWVAPMTAPFFVLAWLELRQRSEREPASELPSERGRIACVVAAIFALVLGTQSVVWANLNRRLAGEIAANRGPYLAAESLGWARETPLDHWGTAAEVIVLQETRQPRTLLLTAEQAADWRGGAGWIPISAFTLIPPVPGPRGWFDWSRALQPLRP